MSAWFDQQPEGLLLCRVTQLSLLRLLSNPSVMGPDVTTRATAWSVVDQLRADARVQWAEEPPQLDLVWRAISAREDDSHKLWTDDYLVAFVQVSDAPLATLDAGFARRYPSVRVETLT